jgi:Lon protease-like protein
VTSRLPVFPLNTVLFPGLVLPLHVFEERYRALVRHLVSLPEGTPREFGVVAIRQGWETLTPPISGLSAAAVSLHEIGCSAELRRVTELPDGRYHIVTVGRQRFRIARIDAHSTPYLQAEVEWLPESPEDADLADLLAPRVLAVFRQYLRLLRGESQQFSEQLPDDPTVLSHLVAATAVLTVDDRQRLLAAPGTAQRLREELRLLTREVTLLRHVRAVPVPLAELAVPASPN